MKTARGVFHNINESDIYQVIDNYTLYFSSNYNRKSFLVKYDDYFFRVNKRLKRIYELDYTSLIIISLYKKVEKRGFRVYYKDRRIYEESIRWEM